jgi:hypothetical protein
MTVKDGTAGGTGRTFPLFRPRIIPKDAHAKIGMIFTVPEQAKTFRLFIEGAKPVNITID